MQRCVSGLPPTPHPPAFCITGVCGSVGGGNWCQRGGISCMIGGGTAPLPPPKPTCMSDLGLSVGKVRETYKGVAAVAKQYMIIWRND